MRRLLQCVFLSFLVAATACGGVSREEIHAALAGALADSTPPEYIEASSWKIAREIYADAGGNPASPTTIPAIRSATAAAGAPV